MELIDIEKFRKILIDQKDELEKLIESSRNTREPVELDQTRQGRVSRQDALMQQEMAKAADRRRQIEVQRIEAALKRLESGDYGYCAACDEPIAEKRLLLDPAVPTCIACAEKC